MKTINVYEVYETVNEYGHRGGRVGVYESVTTAETAAIGVGWYGGKGDVSMANALVTEDGMYILKDLYPVKFTTTEVVIENKKKAIMSKLTLEEQKILGLVS